MSVYLIKVDEVYRADSEHEATQLIDEAKNDNKFKLTKFTSAKKETKDDEYVKVTLTKTFTVEKDPEVQFKTEYKLL